MEIKHRRGALGGMKACAVGLLFAAAPLAGCPDREAGVAPDAQVNRVPMAPGPTTPTARPSASSALGKAALPEEVIADSGAGTARDPDIRRLPSGPARVVGTEQEKGDAGE